MPETTTGEQLRADIDAGRTGDKVAFPDPAAAPLGTDAEAGGATTAFPSERRPGPPRKSRWGWGGMALYIGLILALGAVATLVIFNAA